MRALATLSTALSIVLGGCGYSEPIEPDLLPPDAGTATALGEVTPRGYPPTRRDDVVDRYHGTRIPDPYRWLEDQDSEEVLAWADAQNAVTERMLHGVERRAEIKNRLLQLWNYERFGPPSRHGDYWAHTHNNGLQNQSVLFRSSEPFGQGKVLLDPNTFSEDGTVALAGAAFSEGGEYLAFATARSGSDWRDWSVLNVDTGELLKDHLEWTKFTSAAWTHDGKGFFYQRYPAPEEGEVYESANVAPKLCYHRIGTGQAADEVVYERDDKPQWGFAPTVTEDGSYLVVTIWQGTDRRNAIAWMDLSEEERDVRSLIMEFDARYDYIGNVETVLYFSTDLDAPNGRIIAVDLKEPARENWTEVVPESQHRLRSAQMIADQFAVVYLRDAHDQIERFRLDGTPLGPIQMPAPGSVSGFTGKQHDQVGYFTFSTFTQPGIVYRYDFSEQTLDALRTPQLKFDAAAFVTRQVAYESQDGTRTKMFVTHRKDLVLDGDNPTYLYGYGGFDISLTPSFSVPNIVWLEMGGVFAQATLRGGGEFGESWHEAGMREHKQNVFDDFASAARYLIRNDFAKPAKLAIGGRSNGGLLVAATMLQNPELFGAAVPEVGVLDMLRYHKFTIGWAWEPEYGSSEDRAMFLALRAYSPLHNIHPGTRYPATLIMTGDHDDRVLPGHSYKFAATLQADQGGDAPILLRVTRNTGHGGGKPLALRIDEATDRLTFLVMALGMQD